MLARVGVCATLILFGTIGAAQLRTAHAQSGYPNRPVTHPAFVAHIFFAMLLSGLVVLHVLAALYHQFVRRDGLFRRMAFGRRVSEASAPAE
jgi:cytochrome b561